MIKKGRCNNAKGENHYSATLNDEQVLEVKRLRFEGMTQSEVANKFGVSRTVIHYIDRGLTYKNVSRNETLTPQIFGSKGANHHKAKLSELDVIEVYRLRSTGLSPGKIGKLFRVTKATIARILNGKTWKHFSPQPKPE